MALFLESVTLQPGDTVSSILHRYGLDSSRWPEIRQLSANSGLPANAGMVSGSGLVGALCVPIDDFALVVNYKIARDTANGLRPMNLSFTPQQRAEQARLFAHGVEIHVERDGTACTGLRWVQTIKKLHAVAAYGINPPTEFVDTRVSGFPFYNDFNDPDSPDDLTFSDVPCGPAPHRAADGTDFAATVSLVVWTPPRVTIVTGYFYHFRIGPQGAMWLTRPREATADEYAAQLRILQAGIGQLRQDSGRNLVYRTPPAQGSINR